MRTVAIILTLGGAAQAFTSRGAARHVHPRSPRTHEPLGRRSTASLDAPPALKTAPLQPEDAWIEKLDLEAFGAEVKALGRELEAGQGEADLAHLRKMRTWSALCGAVGVSTMALPLNPVTVMCLSLWTYSRWTMIAHHSCHGGYNRLGEGAGRFRSQTFALGGAMARARDWLDWMLPEAWNLEHNTLHHYKLGEDKDPDLVERNLEFVRQWKGPVAIKYAYVAAMAGIWKWAYYAPNTYKQLKLAERKDKGPPEGVDPDAALTLLGALCKPKLRGGLFSPLEFLTRCLAPVFLLRFVLLPAPLLLLPAAVGPATCFQHAIVHLVLADVLTNLHGFLTIVTNHAGKDLYRFASPCPPGSPTFLLRQVVSSANYKTGGDANDFMHGWLNYQVEHHAWPNLSMLSYQKGQPRLKAICEKYGVPYVQESVWVRLKKTVDIMVGNTSMRRYPEVEGTARANPV